MCVSAGRLFLLVSLIGYSTPSPQRNPNQPLVQVTEDWCRLPQQPKHGFYHVSQKGDNNHQDPSGTYVPHGWVLKYTCNSNYTLSSKYTFTSETSCNHGSWERILDCVKMCEPIPSENAVLTCGYDGLTVDCGNGLKPMRPGTVVSVQCEWGYQAQGGVEYASKECGRDGEWNYPVPRCRKPELCEPIYSENAELTCRYDGLTVPCRKRIWSRTVVTVRCRRGYQLQGSHEHSSIECGSDGKWNYPVGRCRISDCGISLDPDFHTTLITDGSPTRQGEFPWLAALYLRNNADKTKWVQKCGGTLISAKIVLTAAHCLILNDGAVTPDNIKIGLGKYQRDYYTYENDSVIMDVKRIVTPRNYDGKASGFALDIGMISLVEAVRFSPYIMPVCFDWTGSMSLSTGNVGHVAGWGTTENGTSSDVILSGQLVYIANPLCKQNIRPAYKIFVTHDKFCAGSDDGSQVAKGDSGGGLTFVVKDRHYILGVVSSKINQVTTFSLFTDLTNAEHRAWMRETQKILEND